MRRLPPDSRWWTPIITTGSLAFCLVVYYFAPVGDDSLILGSDVVGAVGFVIGLGLLGLLIAVQVRRQVAAGHDPNVRVQSIVGLLCPIVVFFAMTYYLLAFDDPGQFVGIDSRTDALYFTVVTLGTVGYGDVHPVGEAARVVTMIQVVFDLVVIGMLIGVATSRARERVERRVRVQRTEARPGGDASRGDTPGAGQD